MSTSKAKYFIIGILLMVACVLTLGIMSPTRVYATSGDPHTISYSGGITSSDTAVVEGTDFSTTLTFASGYESGYVLPANVTVSVGGNTLDSANYTYNRFTGAFTIVGTALTDDVTVSGTPYVVASSYNVTLTGSNRTTESSTTASTSARYDATFTANEGYIMYDIPYNVIIGGTYLIQNGEEVAGYENKISYIRGEDGKSLTVKIAKQYIVGDIELQCSAKKDVTISGSNLTLGNYTFEIGQNLDVTLGKTSQYYNYPTSIIIYCTSTSTTALLPGSDYTYNNSTGEISINGSAVTDNIIIVGSAERVTWSVTYNLTHVSYSAYSADYDPDIATYDKQFATRFTADSGYNFTASDVDITINGNPCTNFNLSGTKALTIPKAEILGPIVITIVAQEQAPNTFSVTYDLTNVVESAVSPYNPNSGTLNGVWKVKLTPTQDYYISKNEITITMGGVPFTNYTLTNPTSSDNNARNIEISANVITGDLYITANAVSTSVEPVHSVIGEHISIFDTSYNGYRTNYYYIYLRAETGYALPSVSNVAVTVDGADVANTYKNISVSNGVLIVRLSKERVVGVVEITASSTLVNYTINYTPGAHGDIDGVDPGSSSSVNYTILDSSVSIPTVTPDNGYTFTGFKVTTTNGSWTYGDDFSFTTDGNYGNITVTAQYSPIDYTITFAAGDHGTAVSPSSVTYTIEQSSITMPTATAASGYRQTGWAVTTNTGSDWSLGSFTYTSGHYGNITVTATWDLDFYLITLNAGLHGTLNQSSAQYYAIDTTGPSITAPTPYVGYEFIGWRITSGGGNWVVDDMYSWESGDTHTGDITLTAEYNALNVAYTEEHYFEDLNGNYIIDSSVTRALSGPTDSLVNVVTLTRTGYSYNSGHGGNIPSATINGNGTTVLRAYYSLNTHSITYDPISISHASATQYGSYDKDSFKYGAEFYVYLPSNDQCSIIDSVIFKVGGVEQTLTYDITRMPSSTSPRNYYYAILHVPAMTIDDNIEISVVSRNTINITWELHNATTSNTQTSITTGSTQTLAKINANIGYSVNSSNIEVFDSYGNQISSVNNNTWYLTSVNNLNTYKSKGQYDDLRVVVTAVPIQYQITYSYLDASGNTQYAYSNYTIETINEPTQPELPSRNGYTFDRWVIETQSGSWNAGDYTWTSGNYGDVTLTAYYTVDEYNVTISAGAHGSTDTTTLHYTILSDNLMLPVVTANSGWQFTNWKVTTASGSWVADQLVDEILPGIYGFDETGHYGSITVTAQYSEIDYTITINAGTHGSASQTTISYNISTSSITLNDATPSDGYIFGSWLILSTSGDWVVDSTFIWASGHYGDVTIQAQYTPIEYTITFAPGNHGSITNPDVGETTKSVTYTIEQGSINYPSVSSENGYSQTSWLITTASGSWEQDTAFNYSSGKYGNITVTAQYSLVSYTITISAGAHGSSSQSILIYNIEMTSVPLSDATPNTGYNYAGWKVTTASGSWTLNQEFDSVFGSGNYGDITVTAQYTPINYIITINSGAHGTASQSSVNYTIESSSVSITNPSADTGYTFSRWNVTVNSGNWELGEFSFSTAGHYGDITITAQYTPVNYVITIDNGLHGSASVGTVNYTIEDSSVVLPGITYDNGYTSSSWHIMSASGNWSEGTFEFDTAGKYGNITITPNYSKLTYIITFNAGEHGTTTQTTVNYDIDSTSIILGDASPNTAYNFANWKVTASEGNFNVNDIFTASFTAGHYGNITITAQYTPISYQISFTNGTHGSTSAEPVNYTIESTVNPVHATATGDNGYTFANWKVVSNNGDWENNVDYVWASGHYGNVTLEAQYTTTIYTITFAPGLHGTGGGNKSYTIDTVEIDIPSVTASSGYTFDKWVILDSGESSWSVGDFTYSSGNYGDVTVTATYTENGYTITLLPGDHGSLNVLSVNYSFTTPASEFSIPEPTPSVGWEFSKWVVTTAAGNWEEGDFAYTTGHYGNITLTAVYTEATVDYHVTFYFENLSGNYVLNPDEEQILHAKTNAIVFAPVPTYVGYTFDVDNEENVLSGAVRADGGLVLKVYYKLNIYTITVKTVNTEYDSQVLATFENIKHGTAISVSSNSINIYTDPVQEFTADLRLESVENIHTEYNFVNIIAPALATSNATIQVNYRTDFVKYTITFMNGETLLEERVVEYGKDVTYTGETPTKPNEGEYKFVFRGWADVNGNEYTTLPKVSGNTTYYASFEKTKANPALTLIIIIGSASVAVVLTLVTMALIIKRQKLQSIADGDRIVELVDKLDEMSTKNSKSNDKDSKE